MIAPRFLRIAASPGPLTTAAKKPPVFRADPRAAPSHPQPNAPSQLACVDARSRVRLNEHAPSLKQRASDTLLSLS